MQSNTPHSCPECLDEQFGGAVNPVDTVHEYAKGMAAQIGCDVDEHLFDQARKYMGDRHNQDKLPMSLLDRYAVEELVKVLQFGANKYASHNWRKGLSQSEILDSTLRHVFAALDGEDLDPESGLPHIAHAMCNCMFYLANGKYHPELDDRFIPHR